MRDAIQGDFHCVGRLMVRYLSITLTLVAPGILLGCGPELSPISRIETLRLMGIQKSEPFAQPGETVELTMLYEDTREEPRTVETFFAFWCVNPPGDSFADCLSSPPRDGIDPIIVRDETKFSLEIPEDILRPSPMDPKLPDSGMAVVFAGVCAGKLSGLLLEEDGLDKLSSVRTGQALIPRCLDDEGKDVSPDDFIISYSTVLVYEDLRNKNPILQGFTVAGERVDADCVDLKCDAPFDLPDLEGCADGVACIEACKDDGAIETCPPIKVSAVIDPLSAERDDVAAIAYDRNIEESMWVSYFVDRGSVSPPVKLVNDAALGFQDDFSASVYAPKESGPMRLWAVVRDNRGGEAWIRVPAYVK